LDWGNERNEKMRNTMSNNPAGKLIIGGKGRLVKLTNLYNSSHFQPTAPATPVVQPSVKPIEPSIQFAIFPVKPAVQPVAVVEPQEEQKPKPIEVVEPAVKKPSSAVAPAVKPSPSQPPAPEPPPQSAVSESLVFGDTLGLGWWGEISLEDEPKPPEPAREPARRGGRRGIIRGFSRQSRKRLWENWRALDIDLLHSEGYICYFPTLTYHLDLYRYFLYRGGVALFQQHLTYFVRRYLLREHPDAFGLWKKEFGEKNGLLHWHLVLFTTYRDWKKFYKWFNKAWVDSVVEFFKIDLSDPTFREIIDKMYRTATNVKYVPYRQLRGRVSYFSKYVAKPVELTNEKDLRISTIQHTKRLYTTEEAQKYEESTGRWWGYINKKKFKAYQHYEEYTIRHAQTYYEVQQRLLEELRRRGLTIELHYEDQGITALFTEPSFAYDLLEYAKQKDAELDQLSQLSEYFLPVPDFYESMKGRWRSLAELLVEIYP